MVKVKCILGYYDTKQNKRVRIGEELEVAEERANRLIKAKVCELVSTPTTPEKVAKARKKKEG